MRRSRWILAFLALILAVPASAAPEEDVRVENLRAFAKVYGYVRFFHPSDEAASVDWNAMAIHGAGRVKDARDAKALRTGLLEVFRPVAPMIQVAVGRLPAAAKPPSREDSDDIRVVGWQHLGVRLGERSNIYRSLRRGRDPAAGSLFPEMPQLREATEAKLPRGLAVRVPLALLADAEHTWPRADAEALAALRKALDAVGVDRAATDDEDVRLGLVVASWNVLQHFYPYFDVVKVDWDEVLTDTLAGALAAKDDDGFADVLHRMVARLEDGHGVVFHRPASPRGRPHMRLEWIEDRVVVTGAKGTDLLRRGDVVRAIDGEPAERALARQEALVSGSPWLRRHRALNVLGSGPMGSEASFAIERDGEATTVKVPRAHRPNMFFTGIDPFEHPMIETLDGGLVYVNLAKIDEATFRARLDDLVEAKGVIFDYRWGGSRFSLFKILPHLTGETVKSAQWHIPKVIYPDRRDLTFTLSGWPLEPKAPRIAGRCAFLLAPPVVSSGETTMGIVEHYGLGELVGHPTAGCNGNANFIPLPAGFRIMWTGMKVLKHDGSQHHLVGIRPRHPVKLTIAAIREGRDEVLEKAIEVLDG